MTTTATQFESTESRKAHLAAMAARCAALAAGAPLNEAEAAARAVTASRQAELDAANGGRLTGQSCPVCGTLHHVGDDVTAVDGAVFCPRHAAPGRRPVIAAHDLGCASASGIACDCADQS